MVISTGKQKFNFRLNQNTFSDINEDENLTVFLPQRSFDKLHKVFAGEGYRLPADRYTWLEFSWDLKFTILHIAGSNDRIQYRESISSVRFSPNEVAMIQKEIKKF